MPFQVSDINSRFSQQLILSFLKHVFDPHVSLLESVQHKYIYKTTNYEVT